MTYRTEGRRVELVEHEDGLLLDFETFAQLMTEEQFRKLMETVAFQETLLEACTGLLLEGSAFESCMYSNSYSLDGSSKVTRLQDRLREKLLPLMSEVSQKLVEQLKEDLSDRESELRLAKHTIYCLKNDWPERIWHEKVENGIKHIDWFTKEQLKEKGISPPKGYENSIERAEREDRQRHN